MIGKAYFFLLELFIYKSNYSFTMIIQKKSVPPWLHLHHYVEHTSLLKVMLAKHMQMPVGWPVTCGGALKLGKLFTFMLAKWKPSQRHHFPSLLNWVNGDAEIVHNAEQDVEVAEEDFLRSQAA